MNEIVWPTIDSKHLIVDPKQMLILEKEMFSEGMPQEALMEKAGICLLYTSPSPRDYGTSRMPSSA